MMIELLLSKEESEKVREKVQKNLFHHTKRSLQVVLKKMDDVISGRSKHKKGRGRMQVV